MLETMIAALMLALPTDGPAQAVGGVWELAATYDVGFPIRFLATAATEKTSAQDDPGVAVVSDLRTAVAGVRADSGLVVWTRRPDALSGVWAVGSNVIAAGREVAAYRADVGTRLWSRDLGCKADPSAPCDARVVAVDDGGVWLADGGAVQTSLIRLDPETGVARWARTAAVGHARSLLDGLGWVAVAEGQAPYAIRFFDLSVGRELGQWARRVGGVPRPATLLAAGRELYAVDVRPGDGNLAQVIVVATDGVERTTRFVPRDPTVRNLVAWAGFVDEGLAMLVPDPMAGGASLVWLELSAPWSARVASVPSWAEPIAAGGHLVLPPPPPPQGSEERPASAPAASLWTAWDAGQVDPAWSRRIDGLGPAVKTFALGDHLALVDASAPEVGVATVAAPTGAVQGIGAAALPGAGAVSGATFIGDALVLARGSTLGRFVHLPTADVRARLKRGAESGQDIGPVVKRLGRFGPLVDGLVDPTLAVEADPGPSAVDLSAADNALLDAFREAWAGDAKGTLEGLVDTLDRADATPAGRPRRAALLDGIGRLVAGEVLATGVVPRDEDARAALIGLARSYEGLAGPRSVRPVALWSAIALRMDEPLLAADLLSHARQTPLVEPAYMESARRALRAIRTSAGALASATQRDMLVAGLRFFRHLDAVLGAAVGRAAELMDQASGSASAARELAQILVAAEGQPAGGKSALGPAACALACDAAASLCEADQAAVDRSPCEVRCLRQGVVRFTDRARPLAGEDRATWLCR